MKKYLFFIVAVITAIAAIAESKIYVVFTDGTEVEYPVSKIDSIRFEKDEAVVVPPVPEPVDSCLIVDIEDCEFKVYTNTKENTAGISDPNYHNYEIANVPCAVISDGDTFKVTTVSMDKAWQWCGSINIPSSVTEIYVYDNSLRSATSINVSPDNRHYCSIDGILYTKDTTKLIAYPNRKKGTVVIPSSVTSIGEYAFQCCDSLTSIDIPSSVTSIGEYAFEYCYIP